MIKHLLAGVAVIGLTIGAASAQIVEQRTTTTTTAPTLVTPLAPLGTTETRTERATGIDGSVVRSQETVKRDAFGNAVSSKTEVVRPDGSSETTVKKEWSTPSTSSTTTTITR